MTAAQHATAPAPLETPHAAIPLPAAPEPVKAQLTEHRSHFSSQPDTVLTLEDLPTATENTNGTERVDMAVVQVQVQTDLPTRLPDDASSADTPPADPSQIVSPTASSVERSERFSEVQNVPEFEDVFGPAATVATVAQQPDLQPSHDRDPRDEYPRDEYSRDEYSRDEYSPTEEPDDRLVEFNGRDCPSERHVLAMAWEEMRRKPISGISLDITPSIEPRAAAEGNDALVQQKLQQVRQDAPPRTWRDRTGKVVAKGRLSDFRNGQVVIESDEGETVLVPWFELSNEEYCFVTAWWGIPSEYRPETEPYELRDWTSTTFTWTASSVCHKPLYFEDAQLERYGHTAGPVKQIALSGAHFFGNIFFLPYQMGMTPPSECKYTLGYYRPGSCAPWMLPAIPLHARGARMQLGAILGGIALFP